MAALDLPAGVTIEGAIKPGFEKVLTREALAFLAGLQRQFNARREELLAARVERQKKLDAGEKPDFLADTAKIRDSDWTVAPLPKDILDRRVEITGPVDRKMIINALNCGANVFMADFEDASTPTWTNMVEGQFNLIDAVRRTIDFVDPQTGKRLQAERQDRGAVRASARLASAREAHAGRRQADVGLAVRFRPLLLPQRQGSCWRAAPARTSTCRRSRAISRRACGTTSSSTPRTRSACRRRRSRPRC